MACMLMINHCGWSIQTWVQAPYAHKAWKALFTFVFSLVSWKLILTAHQTISPQVHWFHPQNIPQLVDTDKTHSVLVLVSSDCLQSAFVRSLLSFSFDVPEVWSRFVEIHNHCLHLSFILSLYWLSEYQPGSFFCLIPMKQFFAASITLATAFKLSISRILNMFIKLLRKFTRKFEILAKPLPWLLHKLHTHNSSKNTTVFPNKFASDLHHICPWIEHVSNKIPNCVNDNTTNRGTIIK